MHKARQIPSLLAQRYMTADELADALGVERAVLCVKIVPVARAIGIPLKRRGESEFLAYVMPDYYRKDIEHENEVTNAG